MFKNYSRQIKISLVFALIMLCLGVLSSSDLGLILFVLSYIYLPFLSGIFSYRKSNNIFLTSVISVSGMVALNTIAFLVLKLGDVKHNNHFVGQLEIRI